MSHTSEITNSPVHLAKFSINYSIDIDAVFLNDFFNFPLSLSQLKLFFLGISINEEK